MNFMIAPGMLVFSSSMISVCMFIVSKSLLISSTVVVCPLQPSSSANPGCQVPESSVPVSS